MRDPFRGRGQFFTKIIMSLTPTDGYGGYLSSSFAGPYTQWQALTERARSVGRSVRRYSDSEYPSSRGVVGPFGAKLKTAYSRNVPPKKRMGKMRNPISVENKLAGRASMKYQTKKLKAKKIKKVRVPRKLRKQIGQVLSGKHLFGKYVTCRMGAIGVCNVDAQPASIALFNTGARPGHFTLNSAGNCNSYSSWFMPIAQGAPTNSASTSSNYDSGAAFTYFHPAKFMDAASVMWNQKAVSNTGWLTQVGNIQTRVDTTTGAIGDTNRTSNVIFDIVNSYVQFEIKNNSQRELQIRILKCTPKNKVSTTYPLDTLITGVGEDSTENGGLLQFGGQNVNDALLSIKDIPYFSGNFKYDVMQILIKPGETCKHSIQGPKNVKFDTRHFLINALDGEQYNMKGTMNCLFQVLPDMQVDDTVLWPGRFMGSDTAASALMRLPLSVEVTECFKLKVPEAAGFIKNNTAAGTTQLLNLKRPINVYGNFANFNEGVAQAYTGNDEEQPGTNISNGTKF